MRRAGRVWRRRAHKNIAGKLIEITAATASGGRARGISTRSMIRQIGAARGNAERLDRVEEGIPGGARLRGRGGRGAGGASAGASAVRSTPLAFAAALDGGCEGCVGIVKRPMTCNVAHPIGTIGLMQQVLPSEGANLPAMQSPS